MHNINIIIFGGTTEGRLLSEYAAELKQHVYVSVTTDYGEQLLKESEYLHVLKDRMDVHKMEKFFAGNGIQIIIDATHPFAKEVTKNIKKVAEKKGLHYYRVVREKTDVLQDSENRSFGTLSYSQCSSDNIEKLNNDNSRGSEQISSNGDIHWFNSLEEITEFLNRNDGDIFVTTGSKEIQKIAEIKGAYQRCVLRILDVPEIVEECCKMGFDRERVIAKRGPFRYEENIRDFEKYHCRYLVTKESGKAGGFTEKLKAAKQLGMEVLVIKRPPEEGISLEEMKKIVKDFGEKQKCQEKEISIIGIGMEGKDTITVQGKQIIQNAELLIGAKRMVQSVHPAVGIQVEVFVSYDSEEIAEYIKKTDRKKIAVLMSGDCGFFSGCKKLLEKLEGYQVKIVSGISSAVYFANAVGISWQDMNFVSLHGTQANIISEIKSHRKTFFLLGGKMNVRDICVKMLEYGYGEMQVYAGENLGFENERILSGKAKLMTEAEMSGLCVMLVVNEHPIENSQFGIKDDFFIRGKVPMTKSEIRAVVMSKLNIKKGDICWDIGCGTGSVSVEMANFAIRGSVYSVDKNAEAIWITQQNANKFGCDNIITVERSIEKGLDDLPVPDVVFIGGGSGNIGWILRMVLAKNPNCKVAITSVSVETVATISNIKKEQNVDIEMTQIAITRTKQVGEHTMFNAVNPVVLALVNSSINR